MHFGVNLIFDKCYTFRFMISIPIAFCISLLMFAFAPFIFPAPVSIFAPFLAIASFRTSFAKTLWLCVLCGFIVDVLSSTPFNMHTWSYLVAVLCLHKTKKHLVTESPFFLFIATILFSSLSTSIQALIFRQFTLSWHFFLTDLFILPLMDGIYFLLCFVCPFKAYKELRTFYLNRRIYEQ